MTIQQMREVSAHNSDYFQRWCSEGFLAEHAKQRLQELKARRAQISAAAAKVLEMMIARCEEDAAEFGRAWE